LALNQLNSIVECLESAHGKYLFEKYRIKQLKVNLISLLEESQVITGKDMIKRKEDKELALFQEALEFEERHRKSKKLVS